MNHLDDPQCGMTDAEICTTALKQCGNMAEILRKLGGFGIEHGYIPNMLGKSRFNRRLHRLTPLFFQIFVRLGEIWKMSNEESIYLIDSFPVPVCHNIRISRCQIYLHYEFRGYNASKKQYFFGLKVHLVTTADGKPVEIFLTPGSTTDATALKEYVFDLPPNSIIYGDKAYNNYEIEDLLAQTDDIHLQPLRKKNMKRRFEPCIEYLQSFYRKAIETANSLITKMFPKKIHAVTSNGFELKAFLFVLAHSFSFAI